MPSTITAEQLKSRLAESKPTLLIDVRTPAEFREAHVAGAVNKPLDQLDPAEFRGQALLVVCRSGSRGQMACDKLAAAGVNDVINVEGGTLACVEAGMNVIRGKKAMSLERQVRIAAGCLVVAGVALSFLHPAWLGLSAFVGSGLVFAGVTDTCGMGMLIARAPWNQVASDTTTPPGAAPRSAA